MVRSRASRTTGIALITGLMVTACGSAGTSQMPASATAGSITPSAEPTTAASASARPASLQFTWPAGATPAVTPAVGSVEHKFVNPGAIIEARGTLHMFANAFSVWPGAMDIVHLTSTDGMTWTAGSKRPALTERDVPFADPGMDVSTGFVAQDGTWVLLIESVSVVDPWVIGRATAPGPDGPWTVDPKPVLEPGATG